MNIWRAERVPSEVIVIIRSDESPLIATVHDETYAPLIARAPEMAKAILNTINLARLDRFIDPVELCYIITESQMNQLRESVGMKAI